MPHLIGLTSSSRKVRVSLKGPCNLFLPCHVWLCGYCDENGNIWQLGAKSSAGARHHPRSQTAALILSQITLRSLNCLNCALIYCSTTCESLTHSRTLHRLSTTSLQHFCKLHNLKTRFLRSVTGKQQEQQQTANSLTYSRTFIWQITLKNSGNIYDLCP